MEAPPGTWIAICAGLAPSSSSSSMVFSEQRFSWMECADYHWPLCLSRSVALPTSTAPGGCCLEVEAFAIVLCYHRFIAAIPTKERHSDGKQQIAKSERERRRLKASDCNGRSNDRRDRRCRSRNHESEPNGTASQHRAECQCECAGSSHSVRARAAGAALAFCTVLAGRSVRFALM